MKSCKLALIGFGGVNRALAEIVARRPDELAAHGLDLSIAGVADLALGRAVRPSGFDAAALAAAPAQADALTALGGRPVADNRAVIRDSGCDILVEASFSNLTDGQPALDHCRWALAEGVHVVTTNKGPIALALDELRCEASARGLRLGYEGTVMSGTPVMSLARASLAAAQVTGFQGVLNGTSNFILSEMEAGKTFEAALQEAQALGYAEADPTADVDGYDVQAKVAILANEILGVPLRPRDVACTGIRTLRPDEVAEAGAHGLRWKLIGSAHRGPGGVEASVRLRRLPVSHPLAGVSGPTNAITFDTALLGQVTVVGPGAGRTETAYALLSDIINIACR